MVILSRDLAGFRIDQMSLLACDTGDHLKGLTLVVIVFSVRLHIPAGTRAAKNESGHPALIFFRKSESFDLKQFTAGNMYFANGPRMTLRKPVLRLGLP